MNALFHGFRHYVDFRGRDTRSQFWGFVIATHLIGMILLLPMMMSMVDCYKAMLQDPAMMDVLERALESVADHDAFTRILEEEYMPQAEQFAENYYAGSATAFSPAFLGMMLGAAWGVVILLPTAATTVRRLRDAGQSPWWALGPVAALLPVAAVSYAGMLVSLVTLVFCCLSSAKREPEQKPA